MIGLLRLVARQIGDGFQQWLEEMVDTRRVRGVHLSVDPYWMTWVRHNWRYRWGRPDDSPYFPDDWPYFWDEPHGQELLLKRQPPDWGQHCQRMGYPEDSRPILFRVILRTPKDLQQAKSFEKRPSFEGYPVVYESRGTCRGLMLSATDSVGRHSPDTAGTAGGFLRDAARGVQYLVSCAHVLGDHGESVFTPGPADGPGPVQIGQVTMSVLPPPNREPGCNRFSHPTPDNLDLALAELDPSVLVHNPLPGFGNPQHVTSIRRMCSQDPVSLFGKTSGRVDAELGSLCLYHEIQIGGEPRCFGDVFAIQYPRPWYFNTPLVRPGDSGAWIVRSLGAITSWDGMLFAGDGATGYACFAETAMSAISQFAPTAAMIP